MIQQVRGAFLVNGVWIPNQFTIFGMQSVLQAAFQEASLTWYVGLCAHLPSDYVALSQITEPSAANGYARQSLPLIESSWPIVGLINGESYIESVAFSFTPVGGDFDTQVNRLFLTDGTQVVAISSIIDGGIQTISAQLSTQYRLFFR